MPFPVKNEASIDIHDSYKKHRWVLSEERIADLKAKSDREGQKVFLAGVAEGDSKVWHLFDKVLALTLDEATMRRRIEQRQDNQFGKTTAEMADILKWLGSFEKDLSRVWRHHD